MTKDDICNAVKKSIPSFEKLQEFCMRDIQSDADTDTHPKQQTPISANDTEVLVEIN